MLNNRLGDIEVNLCVCTELIWMSQSKIFWQTFQSRWVYLEIINQSIPTGFIFVKIYCYELFVCLCYCAPASYRPYSSHLSTSAGPRYSVCFVRSRTCASYFVVRYLNSFLLCEWKQRHCHALLWWQRKKNTHRKKSIRSHEWFTLFRLSAKFQRAAN